MGSREVAAVLESFLQAYVADSPEHLETRLIPFVLAKLLDPVGDIRRVDLDCRVEVTDALHPFAQYVLGPVGVVVCSDVEDDRFLRVIECLDACEVKGK